MITERSCGAVVFARDKGEIKFVIIESRQGIFGFPKGHMEAGEAESETALREIKEETGLDVEIIDGFKTTSEHTFIHSDGSERLKNVVYFLAEAKNTEFYRQESEISSIKLMTYAEAIDSFQYENSKTTLSEANAFLAKNVIKTERIYENDSYCREFSAKVLLCESAEDGYNVILDKTSFFPEGGGQAADKGMINGFDVLDVQISNGVIVHKIAGEIRTGEKVEAKLDWELRYTRMQSHSGEHILSGIVHSLFGYNNVGFHMSEAEMTVDFDGVLTTEDIERVEKLANFAVYNNQDITVTYPNDDEAAALEYRSKLENIEGLRIVTIGDVDCCACCAPHVAKTGEIGLIKVIDSTPNKGGTRITMLAGFEAFLDYSFLNRSNKTMMKALSAPRDAVSENVTKQLELISALKNENKELLKRLAWAELDATDVNGCAYAFLRGVSYDELRHCSNLLSEEGKKVCMLFSTDDDENYIYVVSSAKHDTKPLVKALNEAFDGKGGGKPNYAQGKIISDLKEKIEAFAEEIFKTI